MFQAVSPPIIRSSKLYTQHQVYVKACLLLPLAVAASKLDIYLMLCVQFWAPDDGWRNRLKYVELWQWWRIKYNVASFWLYLKEYINDAQSNECQKFGYVFTDMWADTSVRKDGCVGDRIKFGEGRISGWTAARMKGTVCAWMAEWILIGVEGRECMQLSARVRKCLTNWINRFKFGCL